MCSVTACHTFDWSSILYQTRLPPSWRTSWIRLATSCPRRGDENRWEGPGRRVFKDDFRRHFNLRRHENRFLCRLQQLETGVHTDIGRNTKLTGSRCVYIFHGVGYPICGNLIYFKFKFKCTNGLHRGWRKPFHTLIVHCAMLTLIRFSNRLSSRCTYTTVHA